MLILESLTQSTPHAAMLQTAFKEFDQAVAKWRKAKSDLKKFVQPDVLEALGDVIPPLKALSGSVDLFTAVTSLFDDEDTSDFPALERLVETKHEGLHGALKDYILQVAGVELDQLEFDEVASYVGPDIMGELRRADRDLLMVRGGAGLFDPRNIKKVTKLAPVMKPMYNRLGAKLKAAAAARAAATAPVTVENVGPKDDAKED